MCWLCKASSTIPTLVWSNFKADAGWRATRWTHEDYIAKHTVSAREVCLLVVDAIGFRLDCVLIDILHAVDQGVASHVIDGVLCLLVLWREVFGGGNQEEALKILSTHMKDWHRREQTTPKIQEKPIGSNQDFW